MTHPGAPLIGCGMYAFTDTLRAAWTELLHALPDILKIKSADDVSPANIVFETTDSVYQSPDLLIGHTCGYPYIKRWRTSHVPVAIPEFNAPGCRSYEYSSWFVCRADDPRQALPDFRHATVAVNHADSNSGMNVLRHAIKDVVDAQPFFHQVMISGSHLERMPAVIRL